MTSSAGVPIFSWARVLFQLSFVEAVAVDRLSKYKGRILASVSRFLSRSNFLNFGTVTSTFLETLGKLRDSVRIGVKFIDGFRYRINFI